MQFRRSHGFQQLVVLFSTVVVPVVAAGQGAAKRPEAPPDATNNADGDILRRVVSALPPNTESLSFVPGYSDRLPRPRALPAPKGLIGQITPDGTVFKDRRTGAIVDVPEPSLHEALLDAQLGLARACTPDGLDPLTERIVFTLTFGQHVFAPFEERPLVSYETVQLVLWKHRDDVGAFQESIPTRVAKRDGEFTVSVSANTSGVKQIYFALFGERAIMLSANRQYLTRIMRALQPVVGAQEEVAGWLERSRVRPEWNIWGIRQIDPDGPSSGGLLAEVRWFDPDAKSLVVGVDLRHRNCTVVYGSKSSDRAQRLKNLMAYYFHDFHNDLQIRERREVGLLEVTIPFYNVRSPNEIDKQRQAAVHVFFTQSLGPALYPKIWPVP